MIISCCRVMCWLFVGELLARVMNLSVPGAVLGFGLLTLNLLASGPIGAPLAELADRTHSHFNLLFVPAGVGVVAHLDVIRADLVPIVAVVVIGTLITLLMSMASMATLSGHGTRAPERGDL